MLPLWRSPLAAVILAGLGDREGAENFFRISIAEETESVDAVRERELFLQRYRIASERGCFVHREPRRGWSVNFPVAAGADMYGVCIYGSSVEERSIDRMQFECSRLASRLSSLLNGYR